MTRPNPIAGTGLSRRESEFQARRDAFSKSLLDRGVDTTLSRLVLQHGISMLGEDVEGHLRATIGDHFQVPAASVFLVGSAKVGFSLKPGQFFKPFSAGSDVDVAIVSPQLFSRIWVEVHQMEAANEYFDFHKFKHYHFHGWIRPDKMPGSSVYATCRDWWAFFRDLSGRENFMRLKISGGLYFDEYFLRHYQAISLHSIREHLLQETP